MPGFCPALNNPLFCTAVVMSAKRPEAEVAHTIRILDLIVATPVTDLKHKIDSFAILQDPSANPVHTAGLTRTSWILGGN